MNAPPTRSVSPPTTTDTASAGGWPPGRVLVVAATYNEAENISELVSRVLAADPDLQLLVVDDDSPDGTGTAALRLAAAEPRLHVLIRRGRRGLGGAVVEGFRTAADHGFAVAVNLDGDLSHDPDDIPRLLVALDPPGGRPADVALGSRHVPGGAIVGWPWGRHVSHWLVGWFTRFILGVPVRDGSTGFRAVRLERFMRLPEDHPAGYAFFEEMLWQVHRQGGRIVEVPITFIDRQCGRSKAGPAVMVAAMRDLLGIGWRAWLPWGS
ncbi:MAG: polyprenol monophosphomannose synthase [Pirellulales bacterium]